MQVSNSGLRSFATCRRRWYLETYQGYATRPENRVPVGVSHLGNRVHVGLEALYGYGLDPVLALREAYRLATEEFPGYKVELAAEQEYARVMTVGYLQWAAEEGIDADLEVVSTEQVVSHELPARDADDQPVVLVGKLDQVVRRRSTGARMFRDWKTVGSLGKANDLPRDWQTKTYAMLQACNAAPDERVEGGLYTMLLRSKRTVRAKPPFYQQVEVVVNRHDLNMTYLRILTIVADLTRVVEAIRAGADHRAVAYPTPGDYCNWGCPFVKICHLFDDGSRAEDALAGNYVRGDAWAYYNDPLIERVRSAMGSTDVIG